MDIFSILFQSFDTFFFILARIIGIFITGPFFSRREMPAMIKVGLSVIMSYLIMPFLVLDTSYISTNIISFLLIAIKEFMTGVVIGISCQMIFNIFISAGANADLQLGLSMAQMVDPSTGSQVTNMGRLYVAFGYLIFLATDAHHLFLRGLINSFEVLPIGQAQFHTDNFLNFIVKIMLYIGQTSLLMVMPIMIVMFLGNLLLAFMAKVMPQMNVFVVGMPFKILIGFIIIAILMPHLKDFVYEVLLEMIKDMSLLLRILNGG